MKFPKSVTEPGLCKDGEEFLCLMFGFIATANEGDPTEALAFADTLKLLFHEYLALTLRGDLEPYRGTVSGAAQRQYRDLMMSLKQVLAEADAPMVEGDDGSFGLDFETLMKGHDMSHCVVKKHGKSGKA